MSDRPAYRDDKAAAAALRDRLVGAFCETAREVPQGLRQILARRAGATAGGAAAVVAATGFLVLDAMGWAVPVAGLPLAATTIGLAAAAIALWAAVHFSVRALAGRAMDRALASPPLSDDPVADVERLRRGGLFDRAHRLRRRAIRLEFPSVLLPALALLLLAPPLLHDGLALLAPEEGVRSWMLGDSAPPIELGHDLLLQLLRLNLVPLALPLGWQCYALTRGLKGGPRPAPGASRLELLGTVLTWPVAGLYGCAALAAIVLGLLGNGYGLLFVLSGSVGLIALLATRRSVAIRRLGEERRRLRFAEERLRKGASALAAS
jgi:hypothetical protein